MAPRRTADGRARASAPDLPEFAIARPRLERILDEGAGRRLTLVAAPAGYGKTLLMTQWAAARRPSTLAWLTIDERDRDPSRLGTHLVGALEAIRPAIGQQALAVLSGAAPGLGGSFVDLLLEDLQGGDEDVVIVLDDFDRLEGPSVGDLGRLILEAPPRIHFMITCRSDPGIPVHRLRSRGELVEPRVGDLRFTATEAAQVVEAVSAHRLSADEAAHVIEITEGWPVAVELAALSLRGATDASALLRLTGADRTIVDYLYAEVLQQEAPERSAFLLDLSVLDEVSGDLADRITGASDGARMLEDLERRGLFVTSVAGDPGWYRLHRLVREFLRHDLRKSNPDRPAVLLGRAAGWWIERGSPDRAAACLIEAREWERLLELVFAHAHTQWDKGRAHAVLGWIEAVPESRRRPDARLRLTEAALELIVGRVARAAVAVVELEREIDLTRGEQLMADMIMGSLVTFTGPREDTLARVARAIETAPDLGEIDVPNVVLDWDAFSVTCLAATDAAMARLMVGDGSALDDSALSLRSPAETPAVCRVLALGMSALLDALAGRLVKAVGSAEVAAEVAGDSLSDGHPATIFWKTALAVVARLRGDPEEAADLADAALAIAVRWRRWPIVTFLSAEQALIELSRGEPDAALLRLRARTRFPMSPSGPMIDGRMRSAEVWAGLATGRGPSPVEADTVSWELAAAGITAALVGGDVGAARKALDGWPALAAPLGEIERELATALVELAEGATTEASARVAALLRLTELDGVVGPFVAAGELSAALLDRVPLDQRSPHLEVVLERIRRAQPPKEALVDPLSARELEVLQHLPTRMSNAEIAQVLFVSTNTIKTHVKHIYQKLAATDRDDAVRIGRENGLL